MVEREWQSISEAVPFYLTLLASISIKPTLIHHLPRHAACIQNKQSPSIHRNPHAFVSKHTTISAPSTGAMYFDVFQMKTAFAVQYLQRWAA
jgi:hypothetical protein